MHIEPVISVIDGYVAVNGVKTEYKVQVEHTHAYGNWELYNPNENDCEKKLYYRVCSTCGGIEWKEGTYADHNFATVTTPATCQAGGYDTKTCQTCGKVEVCNQTPIADHTFETTYTTDDAYHWYNCQFCSATNGKAEHNLNDEGACTDCGIPVGATPGIVYDISADGTYAEVIDYSGTATKVKIASEYNGLPVTTIYKEAFMYNETITAVIIPDSVTTIGDSAFYYCTNLTSVTISDSVTTIGDSAFEYCTNLTSVTIPDSVTTIGDSAFEYCTNLTSVTIPDSVTTIGDWAFHNCTNLTSVTIPDSVTTISDRAFSSCHALTSITIPDSVTTIGGAAFSNCSSLTSVTIGDSVTTIGSSAFSGCSNLTSVTIPDSVITIGQDAFSGCYSLTSVTVNNSSAIIDFNVFSYCNFAFFNEYEYGKYVGDSTNPYAILVEVTNKKMSTYTIHPDTKIIAYGVFKDCERLTNITIPNGVKAISSYAFHNCSNLTSVTIGDSVTTIGDYAFNNCDGLTNVTIPDSVTTIGEYAFSDCSNLTSVTIGESVIFIGAGAFSSWAGYITSATFVNPNGWYYTHISIETETTAISSKSLSDTATAAQYLNSINYYYYWHRTEQ